MLTSELVELEKQAQTVGLRSHDEALGGAEQLDVVILQLHYYGVRLSKTRLIFQYIPSYLLLLSTIATCYSP